ncbi:WXG100 family type VII secretion target [Streptomyces boluensis]|uniref:WXG100 family type VII secretion target n=1 Tax=Streptomyces boluensis TaxID=1775135 RepID=A0A964ULF3_9ACTN|nr:WXG100 family type VII secretion target [Streptomyces boluensis]NBE51378.1 WXG100 family type VII secretion target [Streptomyces boluensis]
MSGKESGAEELVELGLELVNPGGEPEELRQAAKAWRQLKAEIAGDSGLLKALDRNVEDTVGHTWRGEAAEAFRKHWREFKAAVEDGVEEYDDIAKQLDEVADQIETVNEEIHSIYAEIGVSIGVGVALSFVSFGVAGGAAAANVTRLATQAIRISARLGALLRRIAAAIRAYQQAGKMVKLTASFFVNWAGNTGGTLIGAGLSGQKVDGAKMWEATWQGGLAAGIGTPAGAGAAGKVANIMDGMASPPGNLAKHLTENITGGVVGNVAGGLAVDGHTALTTDEDPEWGKNALINAVGGAIGGAAVGGAGHYRQDLADNPSPNVDPNWDSSRYGQRGINPDFAIEVPGGAVGAGLAGAGGELAASEEEAKGKGEAEPTTPFGRQQRSIAEDFG